MMIPFFLVTLSIWSAKADSTAEMLMRAQSLGEIRTVIHKTEISVTYSERCHSELRGNYLPVHCYLWLEGQNMSPMRKELLRTSFDSACEQRLTPDVQIGSRSLKYFPRLGLRCQNALKNWMRVKLYKAQRENTVDMLQQSELGRIFESVSGHANSKSISQKRVHPSRAPRVWLN